MNNGGYVMVDCSGLDLIKGNTPQTISGLYKRVQAAMDTGKPIQACNCVWDDKPVTPVNTFAIQWDGYIICTASTLQIIITSLDSVTINNLVA